MHLLSADGVLVLCWGLGARLQAGSKPCPRGVPRWRGDSQTNRSLGPVIDAAPAGKVRCDRRVMGDDWWGKPGREEGSELRAQRPWAWETSKKLSVGQSGGSGWEWSTERLRGSITQVFFRPG